MPKSLSKKIVLFWVKLSRNLSSIIFQLKFRRIFLAQVIDKTEESDL